MIVETIIEQIEYLGVAYDITANGLVSDALRMRNTQIEPQDQDRVPRESEVRRCTAWLKKYATPRKTPNREIGSYGLKHIVEKWAGAYVSNGAFILAAHRLGFQMIPDDPLSPNATFYANYEEAALSGSR